MMKHRKVASIFVLVFLCSAQVVLAQVPSSSPSLEIPADQVQYKDQGQGGPQLGVVWGDPSKGPYGAFLRLPKGFVSPVHLHTGDYSGVVVEGTVTNAEIGQLEIPLGAGSYFFQRGNVDHVTKCVSNTDCLFYLSQSKPLDFIVHKK